MLCTCNLEKVLNFTDHLEKSLNSVEVLEKYLISLLSLEKSLKLEYIHCVSHKVSFANFFLLLYFSCYRVT